MTIATNLKRFLIAVIAISVIFIGYIGFTASQAQAYTSLANLSSGDLIRGQTFSAVYYYGADGQRYVFPNMKTYETWYSNFDDVKWLTDADLAKIQIGGNVTYKPGVKMIKINTDPKTYAVAAGGTLRHVTSEAIAIELYGSNWNQQIHDMPDGFFSNYNVGTAINSASDYNKTSEMTIASINVDKGLKTPAAITINSSGYSPIDVTVTAGSSVRFTNGDTAKHTVTGDDLSWGSGTINSGESFIKTFDEAGIYGFFDSYDGSNTGAVYVE
ncbi:MAG: cupredoxin domain-containing protein [Patescibacteria group bacterium]|nr:cupredoxin domain-containing protein [Patescibacteria group bacterium]